jgi:hypothetical protein
VDEHALVVLAVAEEVVHRRRRAAQRDLHVVVPHEHAAAGDLVAGRLGAVRLEVAVRVCFGHPLLVLDRLELAELFHAARRLEVVEDRLVPGEALEAHDLFRQQPTVVAEDDVAFAGDIS